MNVRVNILQSNQKKNKNQISLILIINHIRHKRPLDSSVEYCVLYFQKL
jgi:hypothetical protein